MALDAEFWRQLRAEGAGRAVDFHGVKLGDPVERISRIELRRMVADGREVFRPFDAPAALAASSGHADGDGVRWFFTDGRVTRMVLRLGPTADDWWTRLFARRPRRSDVVAHMGDPGAVECGPASVTLHYPRHNLEFIFNEETLELGRIACATEPWPGCEFGPTKALRTVLDAIHRVGWNWQDRPASRVGAAHWQCLVAVGRAFELGDPASVVSGEFIERRDAAVYAALGDRVPGHEPRFVRWCYRRLLEYRHAVEKVLRSDDGVRTASGPYRATLMMSQRPNAALADAVADIDRVLQAILVPDDRSFTQYAMIRDHLLPEQDVRVLELDELRG